MDCTIRVAKTKALISFAVTAREADLRLCFRICKKPVFTRRGSIMKTHWTPEYHLSCRKSIVYCVSFWLQYCMQCFRACMHCIMRTIKMQQHTWPVMRFVHNKQKLVSLYEKQFTDCNMVRSSVSYSILCEMESQASLRREKIRPGKT